MTTTYRLPMYERLQICTPWKGGMLAGQDIVTLGEAARFASGHAGVEITPADFLRAAARGQIPMRAICPRDVTMQPCRDTDKPLDIPESAIPTLPIDACKSLSSTGRASWRTYDWFEALEAFAGELCSFTRWQLPDSEPDIVTSPIDCRLTGWDVHKLADFYLQSPTGQAPQSNIKKKAALIAALEHEWPSIRADISDATRNGLKAAAHVGSHGDWDLDKARAWAVRKGKINQTVPVHSLSGIWPASATKRHTIR